MARDIKVFYNGRLLKVISRPVRMSEQGLGVTYRGNYFLLFNGDSIETAPTDTSTQAGPAPAAVPSAQLTHEAEGPGLRKDMPRDDDWHDDQRSVIEATPSSRIIVEAPPGTGKTAVACARVAFLLRAGVPAGRIWLLSFTRTAVQEIRNRVRSLARDDDEAAAVRIATLDSTAWQLRQGFDDEHDALAAGFAHGIEATITLLRAGNSDLEDALDDIAHLVIDEAQDVMRERAVLVEELMKRLNEDCGVTILCDSAQAIYGFGDETDSTDVPEADTLVSRLKRDEAAGFTVAELSEVVRTNNVALREIFLATRRLVLSEESTFDDVRHNINQLAHGTVGRDLQTNGVTGRSDVLALFRKRSEVLANGAFLAGAGHPFRLRLSSFPARLAPWLALVLADWPSARITRTQFTERFETLGPRSVAGLNISDCWQLLIRHAGATADVLDLHRLRERLGYEHPPIDFTTPEIGDSGPLLSTIHASKGREADEVHLMLSSRDSASSGKEEQRVLFVGATRARQRLVIGSAVGGQSSRLDFGRCYSRKKGTRAQIEIGRSGDFVDHSVVSRAFVPTASDAQRNQEWLATLGDAPALCGAWRCSTPTGPDWRIQHAENGLYVGSLSHAVHIDLQRIRTHVSGHVPRGVPEHLPHIFALCSRTVVRPPDHPDLFNLYEPWATSGMWLAPVIFAYTTVSFPWLYRETF